MEALQRSADATLGPDGVLERLQSAYASLAPRLRKAARYVLDNPNDIGVSSMRQIASAADVAPNTLVRMAKGLGFDGYEEMRRPFRDAMRRGVEGFPDRARWLQSLARSGSHGELFSQLADTSLNNIETLFSITSAADLKRAASVIVKARTAYVLGMGSCFTPQQASLPIDDLARIGRKDVLFAATYRPYRQETVEAARYAKARGARLISLTDSRSSPIAADADVMLLAPTGTPQFFPSMLAMVAMLESLLAFIVSQTGPEAVASIESFHANRSASQVYWPDDTD
jgi:DNA-binding MurR/RpiR family transcriptional regulator